MIDISVIIPVYGVEKYIEQSLRSLFTQTKTKGVEFILVNDCTKDSSMQIAQRIISEYPELNITVINHEVNRGIAATRQTGFDNTKGEYTIQIDSDDYVMKSTMLEDLYAKAKEDDADIVCCNFYDQRTGKEMLNRIGANREEEFNNTYRQANFPSLWTKLIRRSLYTDNNIKINCGVNDGEDYIVLVKLTYFAKIISHIEGVYIFYRYNGKSITSTNDNKYLDMLRVHEVLDDFFLDVGYDNKYLRSRVKLSFKYSCLNLGNKEALPQIAQMFPELDKEICSIRELPLTAKIVLYLASKKQFVLMRAFFATRELAKRVLNVKS